MSFCGDLTFELETLLYKSCEVVCFGACATVTDLQPALQHSTDAAQG